MDIVGCMLDDIFFKLFLILSITIEGLSVVNDEIHHIRGTTTRNHKKTINNSIQLLGTMYYLDNDPKSRWAKLNLQTPKTSKYPILTMESDHKGQIKSSLSLQILVHFNWYFNIFFFALNLCLYILKGNVSLQIYKYFKHFWIPLLDSHKLLLSPIFIGLGIYDSLSTAFHRLFETGIGYVPYIFNVTEKTVNFFLLVSKGNKTLQPVPLLGSWFVSLLMIVLHIYYLRLQTYV